MISAFMSKHHYINLIHMQNTRYDIAIVGGSTIGMITAIILAKAGLSVALVERNAIFGKESLKDIRDIKKQTKHKSQNNDDHDDHSTAKLWALSNNSCRILQQNGVLRDIAKYGQPVNHIRIVDGNSSAKVDFDPEDIQADHFGYMIDERIVNQALYEAITHYMERNNNLHILDRTSLEAITVNQSTAALYGDVGMTLTTQSSGQPHDTISASLIIGADGKYSAVREIAGIGHTTHDYHQSALICDIQHEWEHDGVAVEKFTPDGPFAILPQNDPHKSSLVWICKTEHTAKIQSSSKQDKALMIAEEMDGYLGKIELISNTLVYPIKLIHSKKYASEAFRTMLVGDAAHAIHPLAGQGVNLGFKDVELVTNKIQELWVSGLDIGYHDTMMQYHRKRKADAFMMIQSTSFINSIFSNNHYVTKALRRVGLKSIDRLTFLKKFIMLYADGRSI